MQNGRLFVVGRDDEMIVSGGENVYPIEVEKTLASHADVAEAAVIGVDDEQYGQRLAAFVVLNDGAGATPDTLKQHVRESLANYKVPRQITVLDELPRSITGKIVRKDLQRTGRQWVSAGPLLRAGLELANAANGVRPFGRDGYPTVPAFFAGWPTTEMAPLYMAGSMLGAVWRWLRGDYATARGRIALLLKAITWGLLYSSIAATWRRSRTSKQPLRDTLGDDYEAVAAAVAADRGADASVRVFPNEFIRRRYVEKTDIVRYGPHPR